MLLCGVMFDGALVFRKLSESNSQKKRQLFDQLVHVYGSAENIPLEAWREVLSPESFRVTRLNLPESSHSGALTKNMAPGNYSCYCCGADLFQSIDKFGLSGYLTFSRSIAKDKNIERVPDTRYGMKRVEARCKQCCAHLGHVFPDNVSDSGEKFVINSVALDFNVEKYDVALRKCSIQSL